LLLEIGSDAWRSNQTLRAPFKRWSSSFLIHDQADELIKEALAGHKANDATLPRPCSGTPLPGMRQTSGESLYSACLLVNIFPIFGHPRSQLLFQRSGLSATNGDYSRWKD